MFSFLLLLGGIYKEKRTSMEVKTCGESWKVGKTVLIFIYTSVIFLRLASMLASQVRSK